MEHRVEKRLSARALSIQPSPTLSLTARAKEMKAQGIDVVGFGAGEPDFPTPKHIVAAAIAALEAGDTYYTATRGAELNARIREKLKRDNGLEYGPNEVFVSSGAKHALQNIMQTLCEDGDEVILPAPYWVSYIEQIRLAGAQPVVVLSDAEKGFKITPEDLEARITPHTKAFMFNSPSNPTGSVYTPEEMEALAAVLSKHGVWCISDEIYEKLIYDDARFAGMASMPGMKDLTITVNGHSKAYSMTGWRVGYAAGPEVVIAKAASIQSHTTSAPAAFAQAGAAEALKDWEKSEAAVKEMAQAFVERRNVMVERLNAIPGVRCLKPEGAFYVFPDISGTFGRTLQGVEVQDSMSFSQVCLDKALVALVPGAAFGADEYVRLSYATSMENIEKGLDRLADLLKK